MTRDRSDILISIFPLYYLINPGDQDMVVAALPQATL
jgi:hypothetical protein